MNRTTATTHIEVNVECPECGYYQSIFAYGASTYDSVREEFNATGEMRSDDCEIEITCEGCKSQFVVERIEF